MVTCCRRWKTAAHLNQRVCSNIRIPQKTMPLLLPSKPTVFSEQKWQIRPSKATSATRFTPRFFATMAVANAVSYMQQTLNFSSHFPLKKLTYRATCLHCRLWIEVWILANVTKNLKTPKNTKKNYRNEIGPCRPLRAAMASIKAMCLRTMSWSSPIFHHVCTLPGIHHNESFQIVYSPGLQMTRLTSLAHSNDFQESLAHTQHTQQSITPLTSKNCSSRSIFRPQMENLEILDL